MFSELSLGTLYEVGNGRLSSGSRVERRLADLRGCFADTAAFDGMLQKENPLLYAVSACEPGSGEGDLHYGLGILYPGKVGSEYFFTKGHLHSWRPAAEVYIGLAGRGVMLLEEETTGVSRMEPLEKNSIVYVPGHVAHRTMNTGTEPLVYLGIYPAKAGHDYGAIAECNFRMVVVERDGRPEMIERKEYQRLL